MTYFSLFILRGKKKEKEKEEKAGRNLIFMALFIGGKRTGLVALNQLNRHVNILYITAIFLMPSDYKARFSFRYVS